MSEDQVTKKIADLDELIGVIRDEMKEAKDAGDHVEAYNLQRELTNATDQRRKWSAELHLIHHPKKRASHRAKKVRCPDCGCWCEEDLLAAEPVPA